MQKIAALITAVFVTTLLITACAKEDTNKFPPPSSVGPSGEPSATAPDVPQP
ncbi:MAG: hypothetical protein AAB592_02065 [Patescibacteria group bacterium]